LSPNLIGCASSAEPSAADLSRFLSSFKLARFKLGEGARLALLERHLSFEALFLKAFARKAPRLSSALQCQAVRWLQG
jgi:hypothetical protein